MWQSSRIVPGLAQYLAAKGLAPALEHPSDRQDSGPSSIQLDVASPQIRPARPLPLSIRQDSGPSSIQLDVASPQIRPARPLPLSIPNPPAKRVKVDAPVRSRPSKSSTSASDAFRSDAVPTPSASIYPNPEKSTDDLPPLLRASLLPFQTEGIAFAINKGGRVLIGDDMGLGKTIQAISLCWLLREHWPVLIVMPASMRAAWAEELERWLPALHPGTIKMWYCARAHARIESHALTPAQCWSRRL